MIGGPVRLVVQAICSTRSYRLFSEVKIVGPVSTIGGDHVGIPGVVLWTFSFSFSFETIM
jgi:hypothetical protein